MCTIRRLFYLWIMIFSTLLIDAQDLDLTPNPLCASSSSMEFWSSKDATSLESFKIEKISFGRNNYKFVPDPLNGEETVLRVFYPKGSRTPTSPGEQGGLGFYSKPIALEKEVTLEYKVFFPEGFDFVKGGKLPGIYGGSPDCPDNNNRRKCFTTRFMFRTKGEGEIYIYAPLSQAPEYCHIYPRSVCNPNYGDSLARGSFQFTTGKWHTLKQSLHMNDVGEENGILRVWADGNLVIDYHQLVYRTEEAVQNIGMIFHTFFGGSTPLYSTPKDQFSYFKDFNIYNCTM
ncbi:hypothetical protein K7432_011455 [Basidiobolus ranarum]|uniref:Polysaccharide lyase 14 domain-containing protein n=1 Tax=Basidiobolus ranarum TaxID=34480 RepID=A0ABR2VTT6_9FUNG